MRVSPSLPAVLLVFSLAACGGGGSGSGSLPSTQPAPNAGAPAAHSGSSVIPALYDLVDLGANVQPSAINSSGTVVGNVANGVFFYRNGSLTRYPGSELDDVNDAGVAVGFSTSTFAEYQSNGTITPLNVGTDPNLAISDAHINNAGTVAAITYQSGIAGFCTALALEFSVSAPPVGLPQALSLAINNSGFLALGGFSQNGGPGCAGTLAPFYYPGGKGIATSSNLSLDEVGPAGTIYGDGSAITDMNDAGHVVGFSPITNTNNTATFVSNGSSAQEIDSPVAQQYASIIGNAINNADVVVGNYAGTKSSRAFVWVSGTLKDLNTLIPASCSQWVLTNAQDVNDSGEIVGTGTLNGIPHGFLLVPHH